jgi:hypothetical protein
MKPAMTSASSSINRSIRPGLPTIYPTSPADRTGAMPQPTPKNPSGALNTLNQSLSVEEWQQALAVAKERAGQRRVDEDRRDLNRPRHEAVRRCLLRVDRGESAAPGLYVVRSRDISDGGMRLVHGGRIRPGSICCVIIETESGDHLAAGGEVSWCNPIDGAAAAAYELGIRFYAPIDASRFAPRTEPNEDAA